MNLILPAQFEQGAETAFAEISLVYWILKSEDIIDDLLRKFQQVEIVIHCSPVNPLIFSDLQPCKPGILIENQLPVLRSLNCATSREFRDFPALIPAERLDDFSTLPAVSGHDNHEHLCQILSISPHERFAKLNRHLWRFFCCDPLGRETVGFACHVAIANAITERQRRIPQKR